MMRLVSEHFGRKVKPFRPITAIDLVTQFTIGNQKIQLVHVTGKDYYQVWELSNNTKYTCSNLLFAVKQFAESCENAAKYYLE